jgi:hypothetical protein
MQALRRFNKEMRKASRLFVGEELVLFHKKLALDILRSILKKMPVDTGRARGAWRLTISRPSEEVGEGTESIAEVTTMAVSELGALRPFQTVWLTNNVPYILELEDGSSDQAPHGMVSVTLAEAASAIGGARKA